MAKPISTENGMTRILADDGREYLIRKNESGSYTVETDLSGPELKQTASILSQQREQSGVPASPEIAPTASPEGGIFNRQRELLGLPVGGEEQVAAAQAAPVASQPSPGIGGGVAQVMEVSKGSSISPENLKGFEKGVAEEKAGLAKGAEAQSQLAQGQAEVLRATSGAVEELVKEEAAREQIRQQDLQKFRTALDTDIAKVQNLQIDPMRFYKQKGTGGQIAAGIAIALGAIGNAIAGRQGNEAMDIINRAIDRDIDAQKVSISNQREALSQKQSLYSRMLDTYKDERAASSAARAMMLEGAKLKMDLMAAQSRSAEVAANYQIQSGKLAQEIAKARMDFEKAISDKVTIRSESKPSSPAEWNKAIGEVRGQIKQDPELEDYLKTRQGVTEMRSYLKNGQAGLALVSLISKGLQQGSFGQEMNSIARQQGIVDYSEDSVKKWLGAADRGQFIKAAFRSIQDQLAAKEVQLGDKINLIRAQERSLGVPEGSILSKSPAQGLLEASAKDKRVSK